MNKENIKIVKCDVCKNMIEIDHFGNGECTICGWRQSEETFLHPSIAGIRNIPSLNSAIEQYNLGKSAILANFNNFINAYKNYGEVEFTLNNIRCGVLYDDLNKKVALLNIQTNEKQNFINIDDFVSNAKIDGTLLKNIWNRVTNTDFLQET